MPRPPWTHTENEHELKPRVLGSPRAERRCEIRHPAPLQGKRFELHVVAAVWHDSTNKARYYRLKLARYPQQKVKVIDL